MIVQLQLQSYLGSVIDTTCWVGSINLITMLSITYLNWAQVLPRGYHV
jgi:hypothetical protein